jgi:hypothetical protein
MRVVTLTYLLAHLCCATSAAALHWPLAWSQTSHWTLNKAVVYRHLSLDQALRSHHAGVAVLIVGTEPPKRQVEHEQGWSGLRLLYIQGVDDHCTAPCLS